MKHNKKQLLLFALIAAVAILATITLLTVNRLTQLGLNPIAPNAPESKPAAAGNLVCTTQFTVAKLTCNQSCDNNNQCQDNLFCDQDSGTCRLPDNPSSTSCEPAPSPSPTPTPTPPVCPAPSPNNITPPLCAECATCQSSITWTWQHNQSVTQYQIDILDGNDNVVEDNTWVDQSQFSCNTGTCSYTTQHTPGTYYARITSKSPDQCTQSDSVLTQEVVLEECPREPLVCTSISGNTLTPKLGDNISFTCTASGPVSYYEFRYRIDGGSFTQIQFSSQNPSQSLSFPVTLPGTYDVQCRSCDSDDICEEWDQL